MVENLTEKQKETLEVIEMYIDSNGMPPTLAELQVLLDVNSNQAVLNHLDALEEKGYIERKKTARGIQVKKGLQDSSDTPPDLIDLLTEIAAKKKLKTKKKTVSYPDSYSADQTSGQVLESYYNNEQY